MTITIDTINDFRGPFTFTRLDDGRLECVDASRGSGRTYTGFVDTDQPIVFDRSRFAWLPLTDGRKTSVYPAQALSMAVAFGMRVQTEDGTFGVTGVA